MPLMDVAKAVTLGEEVPIIVIPPFRPRSDHVLKDDEFYAKLNGEARMRCGTAIVTDIASAHTNRMVKAPGERGDHIPAQMLVWTKDEPNSLLFGTAEGRVSQVAQDVAGGIRLTVEHILRETQQQPWVFQLIGYSGQNDEGLSPNGPASSKFNHVHIMLQSQAKATTQRPISTIEALKYHSPVNTLLQREFVDLLTLSMGGSGVTVGEVIMSTNQLKGVRVTFEKPIEMSRFLEITYGFGNRVNRIYQIVKEGYREIYCSMADKRDQIARAAIAALMETCQLSEELADRIFNKGNEFKPTLKQVTNWLEIGSLDAEARGRLSRMQKKFEKRTNDLKANLVLKNRYPLVWKLAIDQIEGDGTPEAVLGMNAPWRWITNDYEIKDEKLQVKSVDFFPQLLMKGGNTAETIMGALIDRQM